MSAFVAVGTFAAGIGFTPVPSANPKAVGTASPNILPPELTEALIAQGSNRLENPALATATLPGIGFYGYDNDGPMLPAPGDLPSAIHKVEATKTEPDKNTYLVLRDQHGPDAYYDYGTHFLFQGHEAGRGYITRINLDADGPHRVTLMATQDTAGNPLPTIDGSAWYPFSERLLFTSESKSKAGVVQATADYPSTADDLSGIFGQAGYEALQADRHGRIILVEDIGGSTGAVNIHAKQPNSFLYRFVPNFTSDLKRGGKLQVLQLTSLAHPGQPIIFHAGAADADILSQDVKDLHSYGKTFQTKWITIHDTGMLPGTLPLPAGFDANALAKAALGTPFKRPENGQFRPGTNFSEFIFDETGDTNILTEAGTTYGGFGAIFRLRLYGDNGALSLVYNGDSAHSGFDNCAFWDEDRIVFVEDAGDTLHTQRNALDSAWLFNLNVDYSDPSRQPKRILAEGRDASATLDSGFSGMTGFQNDGDNEITGWMESDGDPGVDGLLGAKIPTPFRNGWRLFYTQQHGDNNTWEILRSDTHNDNDRNDHDGRRDRDHDGRHDRDHDDDRDSDHDRR